MLATTRRDKIYELLQEDGSAKVLDMAKLFKVGNRLFYFNEYRDNIRYSDNGMVKTICWSAEDEVQYALEGVIVTYGATIEWLIQKLNCIN